MATSTDKKAITENSSKDSPAAGVAVESPRILLAEDDDDIRQLGAEVLIQAGYIVVVAEDGAAAWEDLQLAKYDLLVTDNSMPRMSGVDLLKQLRNAGSLMPVIMASGTLPKYEFERFPELLPAKNLLKPYSAEELLEAVRKVLHGT